MKTIHTASDWFIETARLETRLGISLGQSEAMRKAGAADELAGDSRGGPATSIKHRSKTTSKTKTRKALRDTQTLARSN